MKIKVSTVAFSLNTELVQKLKIIFQDVVINDEGKRFSREELISYFSDADAVIVGLEKIDESILLELPRLKIIAKYGVGLDNIDLDACKKHNIEVGWTPGVNKTSVAEMALGLMLMLTRNLYVTSNHLKQGYWNKSGGVSLFNQTIGIIGLGHIGKDLVRLLNVFGCKILANDIIDIDTSNFPNVQMVSKEVLYKNSDIISVHTPLTPLTKNMIGEQAFLLMKKTAFIINTARGGIVDELALKNALNNKSIAGAALDVYETEPPTDTELLQFNNLISTPHIAGNSYEAVLAMGEAAIAHIENFAYKNKIHE
jgi:phosphoglycerate dehydrogenase-like enzyme